jgi:hypothetical protein
MTTKTKTQRYLETFFEEKQLPVKSWEIECNGTVHLFDTEVVIEAIMNTPENVKAQIADVLRKIDFHNGDVNDFLEHVSLGLAKGFENEA